MTHSISRSDFLRGQFSGKNRPLRPPWSVAESRFQHLCSQCDDCIKACPTQIIYRARAGYPAIDFMRGECLFCGDCASACQSGALDHRQASAWSLIASIDSKKCLAFKSIECRSCQDPCETRAITLSYQAGGVAIPEIDSDSCNGCGACFAPCPVDAIQIQNLVEVAA